MASSSGSLLLSCLLLALVSELSVARPSFRPRAIVLPVTKDAATHQYITRLSQRTPLVPIDLTVDLGAPILWVDCDSGYVSSSYRPARCGSAQCSLARSTSCSYCFNNGPRPNCNNNTCGLFLSNTVIQFSIGGELTQDALSLHSTDGSNPGQVVTVPRFLFTCASTSILQGLASGVTGMAGLGRTRIALPSQLASTFSFKRKFAICLTSSSSSRGVIFFGDGPYILLPNKDVSQSLIYTPLVLNPVSTALVFTQGDPSYEYFIQVKSLKINQKRLLINASLLSINSEGLGGTKISTVNPYTVLETSINNAIIDAFVKESKLTRVASVAPFGACFSSKNVGSTRVGPAVPSIDLVLQSESVFWRIFGANSMVSVSNDVLCLAFVDGGLNPRTSIVIGGYQLEDNLLQFDLATSRLGFSSSLLFRQTTCANFNFTSNA